MTKWETYHILKCAEGGIGQQFAKFEAEWAGAKKVCGSTSCLVGHTAIDVLATKRVHGRIVRRLFR